MNIGLIHFSANDSGKIRILLSGFLIILGGAIYVIFRPGDHLFYSWAGSLGMDHFITTLKNHSLPVNLHLPGWIIYSLPNGLWAFAFALIIATMWSTSDSWLKYLWLATVTVVVLGFEMLQFAEMIPGVFCMQDILLSIAGLAAGFYIGLKHYKTIHYENVDR